MVGRSICCGVGLLLTCVGCGGVRFDLCYADCWVVYMSNRGLIVAKTWTCSACGHVNDAYVSLTAFLTEKEIVGTYG
jgi:hypothetical protein